VGGRRWILGKGEGGFIENHVTGDDDTVSVTIKAEVTLVVEGIAKEGTQGGARGELMGGGSRKVGVALATKNAKMLIRGLSPEQGEVGGTETQRFGGENIQEIGSSAKSRSPEGGRNTSMKQEGANDIICGTNDAFSFAVLGGGVGAGHTEVYAMGEEEHAGARVIKLAAVVALDSLDGDTELSLNIGKEVRQGGESVRLES
jgi:hypothetical protein